MKSNFWGLDGGNVARSHTYVKFVACFAIFFIHVFSENLSNGGHSHDDCLLLSCSNCICFVRYKENVQIGGNC